MTASAAQNHNNHYSTMAAMLQHISNQTLHVHTLNVPDTQITKGGDGVVR